MSATTTIVFLLDVDNTLLDNDRIAADLRDHLDREFGTQRQERYWEIFDPTTTRRTNAVARRFNRK